MPAEAATQNCDQADLHKCLLSSHVPANKWINLLKNSEYGPALWYAILTLKKCKCYSEIIEL